MTVGTRSLLFGIHQVFLHPFFVWLGWVRLYGLPNRWETLAIAVHDWGYWGCPNMDGREGDLHAERMAIKMGMRWGDEMYDLILKHSRFTCRQQGMVPNKLCYADKWASAYMPTWLWVLLGKLSGETAEYVNHPKYQPDMPNYNDPSHWAWHRRYRTFADEFLKEAQYAS